MRPFSFKAITVDEVELPQSREQGTRVSILRLDKIHPVISGNKWFKLQPYLEKAKVNGKNHLVTFGGPYSNHLVATAAAGEIIGFKTTGIVRGKRPAVLSQTILAAESYGMQIVFTGRTLYRERALPAELEASSNELFIIDQGGYGPEGALGASEILNHCPKEKFSHIACAVGTATTMAGIIKTSSPDQTVLGISVLKNNFDLEQQLGNLLSAGEQKKQFRLIHDYHFGGYAKSNRVLLDFMNEFFRANQVPMDFVYTGKLFYGIFEMIKKNQLPEGSSILVIHSGGLQGNLSLPAGSLIY